MLLLVVYTIFEICAISEASPISAGTAPGALVASVSQPKFATSLQVQGRHEPPPPRHGEPDPDANGRPTYGELEAENAALRREVASLKETVGRALARIEELERGQKRQAAPFSKGKPKPNPKPPGGKPGDDYGPWACRARPEQIDETLEVPLPGRCPDCRGTIEELKVDEQIQTDLPPIRPITRRFRVHVGRCRCCGRSVRPRHALQTSDATGAAAV